MTLFEELKTLLVNIKMFSIYLYCSTEDSTINAKSLKPDLI